MASQKTSPSNPSVLSKTDVSVDFAPPSGVRGAHSDDIQKLRAVQIHRDLQVGWTGTGTPGLPNDIVQCSWGDGFQAGLSCVCPQAASTSSESPFSTRSADSPYGGKQICLESIGVTVSFHSSDMGWRRYLRYGQRRVFLKEDRCPGLLKSGLGCFSWGILLCRLRRRGRGGGGE